MYNYRRVYTSTSKFKKIYGDFSSPIFLDYRIITVLTITVIANVALSLFFGLYTLKDSKFTYSFGLLVFSVMATYKLDQKLKIADLPFETTVRYMVAYVWLYWFGKKQIYQDQRLDSNNKRYKII
ncbi:MFS transporter permease [Leuconostoc citreum]|uniref:MFS transporter permease n=1 Tax=Leuconostoc citreum TaxID=33964 RepID=UPI00200A4C7C|nr:MFS transporter permease [Leuconostoc citreum]MCK8605641.1 MFS transporter permease [Leuconostoc citreum]